MSLVGFLLLISAALLRVQDVYSEEQYSVFVNGDCGETVGAFYRNNIRLVPEKDGYNATLTFSVKTCNSKNGTIKSIKVEKLTEETLSARICTMTYKHESWTTTSGCTYNKQSQHFSVTSHMDNNKNETWILVGVFQNGDSFSRTVQVRAKMFPLFPPEKPRQVSFVLVVSATVGVIIAITFITLTVVCCLRSKNNLGATQDTSQQPPVSGGDTYYLHPINPDAVPKPVHTQNSQACRQQSHTRSDEDDDGYTFPDLPRSAGRKRDVPKPVYTNTRVLGDITKPKGRTSKPSDDGYILPDPVHPDKIKRGDDQYFLKNMNTDATNKRSDARRAPRSHTYDDDGYVAPNPAVSNQRGQVPKTSLYKNTDPGTGQAKATSKKFDDDGYVMSDPLTRCEGKVDTYF